MSDRPITRYEPSDPAAESKPATRHEPANSDPYATPVTPHQLADSESLAKPQTRHEPASVSGNGRPATRHEPAAGAGPGRQRPRRFRMPLSIDERYDYEADLSSGGAQADVVLCRDRASGLPVAIKIYRPEASPPDTSAVLSLTGADPAHVVPFRLDHDEHQVWEVQEYFPLGSLEDLVVSRGRGAQPPDFVRAVLREVGAALHHVHELQITHRDLKPQNILVRDDNPLDCVLADFGLARIQVMSNAVGSVAGTYPYTSPEGSVGRGNKPNDWWGLGVIAHELLTGRHLFASPGSDGFLTENRVRMAFMEQSWSYDDVTDPSWRLLLDGLLAPASGRWKWSQVNEWLDGRSPPVERWTRTASARRRRTSYYFTGSEHADPQSLAAAIRANFDLACDHLASARVADLATWLHGTEVGTQADDLLALTRSGHTTPSRAAVELQLLLDPSADPIFRNRELSPAGLADAVRDAQTGDKTAADWIGEMRRSSLLALAGPYYEDSGWPHADELLGIWWNRTNVLTASAAWQDRAVRRYVDSAHAQLEGVLLGAALSAEAATQILEQAGARAAELPADPPVALRSVTIPDQRDGPGFADAALALLVIPPWLAQRREEDAARARASEAERVEQARQRELERQREAEQRRIARRQQRQQSAARRRATDRTIIGWAIALCATVLVPWLLGRYALRGWLFRPDGAGVFDGEARGSGDYFLSDWTAGCCVIALVAFVLLVIRPWWGRAGSLVVAAILAGAAIFGLMPYSEHQWSAQETITASKLRGTAYPFSEKYYTCGKASKPFGKSKVISGGPDVTYSLFSARDQGSSVDGCNRLDFYQGWRRVKTINLKKGQVIDDIGPETISVSRGKLADTVFTVTLSKGQKLKYTLPGLLKE
jgi:Protein kinase domain